ncbi:MAG TPA: hypothetical protein VF832_07025, partial [Longimicrobiales bacterium]
MSILLGVAFAVLTCGTGYAGLRALGLSKGLQGLALAPSTGLALLAIGSTWMARAGVLTPAGGWLVLASGLGGLVLAARQQRASMLSLAATPGEIRRALALLVAAVVLPIVVLGVGLYGLQAPLSTHDGAWHVETIDALRSGAAWSGWYPPGLHASLAAFLTLVPWIDSAAGTAGAALGLA